MALNHPLHRLIKAPPLSGNSLENSLHLPELAQNFFGVGIIETRSRNYEHPNEFLVHRKALSKHSGFGIFRLASGLARLLGLAS